MVDLGTRRHALLNTWGTLIETESSGKHFDMTDENRTVTTQRRVEQFLQTPTVEQFEELWQVTVLGDSVMGGTQPVLDRHDSIEVVAETIQTIKEATAYDPDWEARFLVAPVVWEMYGRLHPDREPILNSTCAGGLADMGFARPREFEGVQREWTAFKEVYESTVGHAIAGTPHEVPLHHEMSEFLWFISMCGDDELQSVLQDVSDRYFPISGWQDEAPLNQNIQLSGHMEHIEGYIQAEQQGGFEEDGPQDLWNRGYWEDWKDAYLTHLQEKIYPRYELTAITSAEVGPFLDDLTERTTLSATIPTYLLGGQSGGILWNEFRKYSEANPEEAAETLSYLFDEDRELTIRLDRFARFYGSLDTTGGPLMSLATMLLTFMYPTEYVFYKHGLMKHFFETYADYKVRRNYNPKQYWKLNLVCKNQILGELRRGLAEKNPTLLDVYTLLYVWKNNYVDN